MHKVMGSKPIIYILNKVVIVMTDSSKEISVQCSVKV